jgi:uncharacterized UBP type Zn finger protein
VNFEFDLKIDSSYLSVDLLEKYEIFINNGCNYSLYSVVCHHGNNATGGHYTCFCRSNNNEVKIFLKYI